MTELIVNREKFRKGIEVELQNGVQLILPPLNASAYMDYNASGLLKEIVSMEQPPYEMDFVDGEVVFVLDADGSKKRNPDYTELDPIKYWGNIVEIVYLSAKQNYLNNEKELKAIIKDGMDATVFKEIYKGIISQENREKKGLESLKNVDLQAGSEVRTKKAKTKK